MIELHKNTEFEQIYAKFKDKVARYIYGKIPNEHDAEDLTSDVFVKVFKGLSGFDETKASLSTWIYRITQNAVIDKSIPNQFLAEDFSRRQSQNQKPFCMRYRSFAPCRYDSRGYHGLRPL